MSLGIAEIHRLATAAHRGQVRKFSGDPYITHPRRVALTFAPKWPHVAVALLHDVIEDTDVTAEGLLKAGVEPAVVDSVLVLTRRDDESYSEYLDRVIASGDEVAIAIKVADIKDNMRDLPESHGLRRRYEKALSRLEAR